MIRVMSFNIRHGTATDGENAWELRKEMVLERIRAFAPDLLGLQECQDNFQSEYLKAHLSDYGFMGVPRGGMKWASEHSRLEMTAVFYRKESFELLDTGTFWLSKTPEKPGSQSWGSMLARTVTWVMLHSKLRQDTAIFFFNTHFDHLSQKAGRESAKLLRDRVSAIAGDAPVIVCGDFNALKDSAAYRTLIEGGLMDVYRQLHASEQREEGTFHGFGNVPPLAIDWILVSYHFKVQAAEIDRFHRGTLYPSDHFPVTAELSFKNPSTAALKASA